MKNLIPASRISWIVTFFLIGASVNAFQVTIPRRLVLSNQIRHNSKIPHPPNNGNIVKAHHPLSLLVSREQNLPQKNHKRSILFGRTLKKSLFSIHLARLSPRIRKISTIFLTAFTLLLGSAHVHTRPSHASSTTAAPSQLVNAPSKIQLVSSTSSTLDNMIMDYVERYMFSDDQYDPLESAYREAYQDKVTGQNPISDLMLQDTSPTKKLSPISILTGLPTKFIDMVVNAAERRGMDPKTVRVFMAVVVVGLTPISMFYFLLSAGGFFRKWLMRQETKRYGGISDLTAEEKEEEIVEADEDEDDEDEDDDGGDGGEDEKK